MGENEDGTEISVIDALNFKHDLIKNDTSVSDLF
jgi:hypothetical protein